MLGGEGSKANHILDSTHTHIGIGVYVIDSRLRYVEASDGGLISTQLESWVVLVVFCARMQHIWYLRRLVALVVASRTLLG